jgi:hypothetical protein
MFFDVRCLHSSRPHSHNVDHKGCLRGGTVFEINGHMAVWVGPLILVVSWVGRTNLRTISPRYRGLMSGLMCQWSEGRRQQSGNM